MLAIVPARGGSKGIPRKNLRVLHGKPMLLRTLDTLVHVPQITRIFVSTENAAIASIAEMHGYEVIHRPHALAEDETTVAQVVERHVSELDYDGPVGVFQPTSPCLRAETITKAIDRWRSSGADSLVSVHAHRHITWDWYPEGHLPPSCTMERVNRQAQEPTMWVETGGITLCNASLLGRFDPPRIVGEHPVLFEVHWPETIDVDDYADLEAARLALSRRTVLFIITAGQYTGSGHIHRALALADELSHHNIYFRFEREEAPWARTMIEAHGYGATIDRYPDLVIFDMLDTKVRDVAHYRVGGAKAVTFEDVGQGAQFADLVINELYHDNGRPNVLTGPAYAVLRPEFLDLPDHYHPPTGKKLLITFGGTDPSHLTQRFAQLLSGWGPRVLVPPGTKEAADPHRGITWVATPNVARELSWADLVITSCGRTVHEAAAVGTPVIAVAANAREGRHVHVPGVHYAGLHVAVSDHHMIDLVNRLMGDQNQRREMGTTMRAAIDGLGVRRIARRIEDLLEGV